MGANLLEQSSVKAQDHGTSYAKTISRIIGLENASMSASNVTQKLFFGLVHLYLLLLLIASFPAQWTTRTKLVVMRKTDPPNEAVSADSEHSDSDESVAF